MCSKYKDIGEDDIPIIEFKNCYSAYTLNMKNENLYRFWQERLSHISRGNFLEIKNNNLFEDINFLNSIKSTDKICKACINSKQTSLPF